MLLKSLVLQHFQNMLLEQLILQHFQKQYCQSHWFYNSSKNNVAKTNGVTTCPNIMLLKPLVLQQLQT